MQLVLSICSGLLIVRRTRFAPICYRECKALPKLRHLQAGRQLLRQTVKRQVVLLAHARQSLMIKAFQQAVQKGLASQQAVQLFYLR